MAEKKTQLKQMEMFDLITKEGLNPNQYYVLCSMKDSVSPVRVNLSNELRSLIELGWVDVDDNRKCKLNTKAYPLIQKMEKLFKFHKKKTSNQLMGTEHTKRIGEYREIFPAKKLPSGKFARVSMSNLENAFRWFFDNHEYEWPLILLATKRYVEEYRMKNYEYMRTSQYFVRKEKFDKTWDSELANYCDLLLSNEDTEESVHFETKVV